MTCHQGDYEAILSIAKYSPSHTALAPADQSESFEVDPAGQSAPTVEVGPSAPGDEDPGWIHPVAVAHGPVIGFRSHGPDAGDDREAGVAGLTDSGEIQVVAFPLKASTTFRVEVPQSRLGRTRS